jgi:hypothetical protein
VEVKVTLHGSQKVYMYSENALVGSVSGPLAIEPVFAISTGQSAWGTGKSTVERVETDQVIPGGNQPEFSI